MSDNTFSRRRFRRAAALLWFLCVLTGCEREAPPQAALQVRDILGEPAQQGFAQALAPRVFQFPDDHGPHFGFRNEWWYVTGNLSGDDGRRFGFQLTFFRHQLRPGGEQTGWRAPQVYMAHFALTDVDAGHYHFFERFGRPAAAIAGACTAPVAVWLDEWRLERDADDVWSLQARAGELQLRLQLHSTLAPVLQGDGGLSRKSATPGNASYYYSLPQMRAVGDVRDDAGNTHHVTGKAWLDREWSTSALDADQAGWDWFALQLRDGRALMLYQLRRNNGGVDPFSYAALIGADGRSTTLTPAQWRLTPLAYWHSPSGARYPIKWRLRIDTEGIDWQIGAMLPQQWFDGSVKYWEGAVAITAENGAGLGEGYLEMTGY